MAEDGNSEAQAANGQGEAAARQIVVHAQYIKDLSFENPNAPDILINPPSQPDVQIGVNVGARGLNSEQYEVAVAERQGADRGQGAVSGGTDLCRHRVRAGRFA